MSIGFGARVNVVALCMAGTAGAAPLALPAHHDWGGKLGAHRFAGVSSIQVVENEQAVFTLEEVSTLEITAGGDLRARQKNDQQLGREQIFSRGAVFVRPGVGKFVRRPPTAPDEAARVADETTGALAADLALVERFAEVKDGGALVQEGRPAHKKTLSLAGTARAGGNGWRSDIAVSALDGELVIDDATGGLLHGVLHARVEMTRAGHSYEMMLSATHDVSAIGDAGIAVAAPPATDVAVQR